MGGSFGRLLKKRRYPLRAGEGASRLRAISEILRTPTPIRQPDSGPAPSSTQFVTFFLHGLLFGVEVLKVQELNRYQEITVVPTAPETVRGLINLRGQIITAIDLRRRLKMPERPEGQRPMNLVIHTEDGIVSLLVDEIGDVLEISNAPFESVPATASVLTRDLILGVYKLDSRLLLVLDTERAVAI